MSIRRIVGTLVVLTALFVTSTGLHAAPSRAGEEPARPDTAGGTQIYTFPANDVVYPEGIGYHAGTGDFFVGSTNGGAVYRGNAWRGTRQLELFLPAGSDGRTDVRGIKVNPQGQLFLAG